MQDATIFWSENGVTRRADVPANDRVLVKGSYLHENRRDAFKVQATNKQDTKLYFADGNVVSKALATEDDRRTFIALNEGIFQFNEVMHQSHGRKLSKLIKESVTVLSVDRPTN